MTDRVHLAANAGQVLTHPAKSTAPIEPLTVASPGAANSAIAEKAIVITVTRNNHLTIRLPCASTGAVFGQFRIWSRFVSPLCRRRGILLQSCYILPERRNLAGKSTIHRKEQIRAVKPLF